MRNGEPNVYAGLISARNTQLQAQWTRIQMFLVFNTVALPLVFGTTTEVVVRGIISFVGAGIHLALFISALRSAEWIAFYDTKLAELERLDEEKDDLRTRVSAFSDNEFMERRNTMFATRRIFGPVGVAFVVLWTWETVFFLTFKQ